MSETKNLADLANSYLSTPAEQVADFVSNGGTAPQLLESIVDSAGFIEIFDPTGVAHMKAGKAFKAYEILGALNNYVRDGGNLKQASTDRLKQGLGMLFHLEAVYKAGAEANQQLQPLDWHPSGEDSKEVKKLVTRVNDQTSKLLAGTHLVAFYITKDEKWLDKLKSSPRKVGQSILDEAKSNKNSVVGYSSLVSRFGQAHASYLKAAALSNLKN